jgi:hypothetical protein
MNDQATSPPSAFQRHLPFLHRVLSSRRCWKALGFTALGLITLLALFYAVENWRGARAWKEVRDQLRAQGEPLSFAELVPPMPPEEENFAMTPFFLGAFDKTIDPATGKERWRLWVGQRNEQKRPKLGPLGLDLDGTWRLGQRARVVWKEWELREIEKELGAPLNTNDLFGVLGQFVGQASADLVAIEAALQRPHSQFPVRYQDNVGALLPHLSELKWLARMFTFRAHVRLAANEPTPALADILAALGLADTVKNEPILISQIVRQSMIDFALQAIWEGLANRVWTADQIQSLQDRLAGIDTLNAYRASMRGERIFGMDLCDIAERDRNLQALGAPDGSSNEPDLLEMIGNHAPKGWYVYNKTVIARLHADYSLPAIDPVMRRYQVAKIDGYHAEIEGAIAGDMKLFLARLVLPAVGKAAQRFARAHTSLDQAITACALERHRLAHNGYPATLAELAPDYLTAVPHDIMDGQPLRYRLEDGKFTLYSIGVNGTDDGGQAAFKEVRDGGRSWQRDEGDWVWSYPEAANR